MLVTNQRQVFDVLRVTGLSKAEAGSFYQYLRRVETTRGMNSLVAILKQRAHALLAPERSEFRVDSNGMWKGVWRIISRHATKGRRGLRNMLRLLKLGGLFEAPEPTLRDYLEVKRKISERGPGPYFEGMYNLSAFANKIALAVSAKGLGYKDQYPVSSTVVPLTRGTSKPEFYTGPREHIESLDNCPKLVIQFYRLMKELVGYSLPSLDHYDQVIAARGATQDVVGAITILTSDRGMKKRAVVNPFRLLQLGCSRLAAHLYAYLGKYETCFVFDQEAGATWVHQRLAEGVQLTSVDLTSASDNIPLAPQLKLAGQLFPHLGEELLLFERINRSEWWTPFKGVNVKYTRGHGMGVQGSFPLFTTWLLHLLEQVSEGFQAYAIVGDDLVIEAAYGDHLLRILERFDVPVNYGKSLFRTNIAEFVGRYIDPHGNMEVYKASELNLIRDPLGLIRQYGLRALQKTSMVHVISKRRREAFVSEWERRRNRIYTELLVGHCKTVREQKTFTSDFPASYFTGGVPQWLLKAWVSEMDAPWMAISLEEFTVMQDAQNWQTNSRPKYVVQKWLFWSNPEWAVSKLNEIRNLINQTTPLTQPIKAAAEDLADQYEKYLTPKAPDLDAIERDIGMKISMNREKRAEKTKRKGGPLGTVMKMYRLMGRLVARFNSSLRTRR